MPILRDPSTGKLIKNSLLNRIYVKIYYLFKRK